MNRKRKLNGCVIIFNNDTYSSELNDLLEDFCGDVVVLGTLTLDEDIKLKCNLYVEQNIECTFGDYKMYVEGNVEADFIEVPIIYVQGDVYAKKGVAALVIDVDGYVNSEEAIIGFDMVKVRDGITCLEICIGNEGKIYIAEDLTCREGINSGDTLDLEVYGLIKARPIIVR